MPSTPLKTGPDISLLQGKNILVVEDNAINQMLVKHTLSASGASIDICENGTKALENIHNKKYDLVLMDIHMPELDGYQTTEVIRKELKLDIPILAMTALALNGEEDKCISIGMNGYVPKPFTLQSLYEALEKVIVETAEVPVEKNIFGNNEISINLELLQKEGQDELYLHAMVSSFLENTPSIIDTISSAAKARDWNKVHEAAHYLTSSLQLIQIRKLFDVADKIEWYSKTHSHLEMMPILIQQLKTNYQQAEDLLRKRFIFPVTAAVA
jgi:CheY-like chemotaxis protein/HPt (histidine-containing phosphotransfer) domain-containing protein